MEREGFCSSPSFDWLFILNVNSKLKKIPPEYKHTGRREKGEGVVVIEWGCGGGDLICSINPWLPSADRRPGRQRCERSARDNVSARQRSGSVVKM